LNKSLEDKKQALQAKMIEEGWQLPAPSMKPAGFSQLKLSASKPCPTLLFSHNSLPSLKPTLRLFTSFSQVRSLLNL
jgi:hypothetical protein